MPIINIDITNAYRVPVPVLRMPTCTGTGYPVPLTNAVCATCRGNTAVVPLPVAWNYRVILTGYRYRYRVPLKITNYVGTVQNGAVVSELW